MTLYGSPELVENLIIMMGEQRAYLSEIDGAIGDGDHGINMSKGFAQARERMRARAVPPNLPQALEDLAMTLLEGIGGSMGPLYGGFFLAMSEALDEAGALDQESFGLALTRGVEAVQDVGSAQVGDKTLIDTLVPARDTYLAAQATGLDFFSCLHDMVASAEQGQLSTRALQARIGRSARLGERSIGVLDAGATSCYYILKSMAATIHASPT
ncbi:dihydroxyacetone kinase subunit DhaL [Deinococcus sp.]|uniref:dihydroxyacetone kinase subunit DhaL n=1 Tax=Deinococcus sp. TaxID=47478 RepID=UPI00286E0B91|nr:dihydroxyacetone kinase subunit DhaL [Deinococcus sp.]